MGDPKKLRKQYNKPNHPWQKARIDEEKELIRTYGLKNKKEVWKMNSILKKYYREAKRFIASHTKQSEIEKKQLIAKLQSLNLLKPEAQIHDVLEITIKDLMDKRLQTILVKKTLARSTQQARQFIVHGHVTIDGKKIDKPSYLVSEKELKLIKFNLHSPLNSNDHPERVIIEKPQKKEKVKEKEE